MSLDETLKEQRAHKFDPLFQLQYEEKPVIDSSLHTRMSHLEQQLNSNHTALINQLKTQRKSRANATITESFIEIFTSLISLKHIQSVSTVYNLTFPADFSLTTSILPSPAQILLITEALFSVAVDNTFSIELVVDTENVYSDSSMLIARYNNNPLKFLQIGALYPASASIDMTLTNLTGSPQTIGLWIVGGQVDRTLWNDLVKLYFESLLSELGLSL